MAKLIYLMIVSVDGCVESERGGPDLAHPDEEMNTYINQLISTVGTFLYGRHLYESMVYWETADSVPDLPSYLRAFTKLWRAADKIVYSTTLAEPRSQRTRIERTFNADAVRRLKETASQDITVGGPGLAAHALQAGLVDELHMIVAPIVVGNQKRYCPDGVRLNLDLLEERHFRNGAVVLRYAVTGPR